MRIFKDVKSISQEFLSFLKSLKRKQASDFTCFHSVRSFIFFSGEPVALFPFEKFRFGGVICVRRLYHGSDMGSR